MFERYTEHARRTIFFARYEASQYGSPQIESEHLLLALIREYGFLRRQAWTETVRGQIETRILPKPKIATSIDLPLGPVGKRILNNSAEEADRLGSREIDCPHLALGLLREEQSPAAELLRQHGVTSEAVEATLTQEPVPQAEPSTPGPLAERLAMQVSACQHHLEAITEAEARRKLKRRDWTRKQALGHLIDLATAHHQWFARALVDPRVTGVGYPTPDWAAAQKYDLIPWRRLTAIWHELQYLLVQLLSVVPEARFTIPCRIGLDPAIPLNEFAGDYARRVEEIVAEILTKRQ